MNDQEELQEFDLDDILNEFRQEPPEAPKEAEASSEAPEETAQAESTSEEVEPEAPAPEQPLSEEEFSKILEQLPQEEPKEQEPAAAENTVRLDKLSDVAPVHQEEPPQPKSVILELDPKAKLRELKKKLIAGPEKRYYELSELGLGKLQTSVFLNLVIVLLCAGTTTLFAMDLVPQNRLRLVIFSQVLAMLVSALLGSHQMLDGLGDLFKGRFTVNTLLTITFASCCVDAVFGLRDLRVPCCGAFSLEMAMALLARYHRRSTEMAQMDTLRKAIRLHSMVKLPNYYQGKPGILRGYGDRKSVV